MNKEQKPKVLSKAMKKHIAKVKSGYWKQRMWGKKAKVLRKKKQWLSE